MSQCLICLADFEPDYDAVLCEDCCIAGMHLFMQEALCATDRYQVGMSPGRWFTGLVASNRTLASLILHMRDRLLACKASGHAVVQDSVTQTAADCPRCGCSVTMQHCGEANS